MTGLNGREKILTIAAVAIALVAALYVFAIEPVAGSWKKQESRIRYLEEKSGRMEMALRDEKKIIEQHRKLEARAKAPADTNPSRRILERSAQAAEGAGMTVQGVTPLPAQEYDFYTVASARLDIECSLKELVALFADVKESGGMEVERMEIGPRDRDSDALRGFVEMGTTVLRTGGGKNEKETD